MLTYFALGIILFYFVFLRESGDIFWFLAGFLLSLMSIITSFNHFQLKFDFALVKETPIWLPIVWGTTIVALRKFYLTLQK